MPWLLLYSLLLSIITVSNVNAESIKLEQVLSVAMQKQADVLIQKLNIDYAKGKRLSSSSAFDAVLSASAGYKDAQSPLTIQQSAAYGISTADSRLRSYMVQLSKTMRSGLSLTAEMSLSNEMDDTYGASDDNTRTVGLTLGIPFFDLLDGNTSNYAEKSAEEDVKSAIESYYSQISQSMYQTMSAWWNFTAAYEAYKIYRQSQQLNEKYYEDYKKLVEKDERPRSDLIQLQANIAVISMETKAAEKSYVSAGYSLCSSLGIPYDREKFLDPDTSWISFNTIIEKINGYLENPYERRFDILAAKSDVESSSILIRAYKRNLRPDVNINLSAETSSKTKNDPLYDTDGRNRGNTLSAEVTYSFPLSNSSAKGLLMQQMSLRQQNLIQYEELKRAADIDIADAVQEFRLAVDSVALAEQSVAFYEQALVTEKKKQAIGMSTVLDVLSTGDSLRDVMLEKISYQLSAALAAAKLAYVSGAILEVRGGELIINRDFLP
ncbi:MAG: TolC family protein [Deferribacterales bacterium]